MLQVGCNHSYTARINLVQKNTKMLKKSVAECFADVGVSGEDPLPQVWGPQGTVFAIIFDKPVAKVRNNRCPYVGKWC